MLNKGKTIKNSYLFLVSFYLRTNPSEVERIFIYGSTVADAVNSARVIYEFPESTHDEVHLQILRDPSNADLARYYEHMDQFYFENKEVKNV